ncbi:cyclin-dependent kinase 6-like [Contarinia nasturtii]|uniref:cyclin-dependent kinase 6-like n=1 Tax=Contarinia nasturtii TaxID=265458 RepID=UPI0012D48A28|nr:cyclin-dependent kinase 6-like [Contarinia nasturtii]
MNPITRVANYEELSIIGTGAYGTVYKARDLKNPGKIVALKKVRVALTEDGVPMSTLREIALLKQLDAFKHPNIVKLLDVCHGQLERERQLVLFLVFEHLEEDLAGFLSRAGDRGISPKTIQKFAKELMTGVDFLHSHRIIHRDLKPQNLLVSADEHIKLADFGLAKTYDFEMKLTSVVVTLWYRAPEVLLNQPYNSAVDIWSSACIIAELFSRRALFPGTSEQNQLEKIFTLIGTPQQSQWPSEIPILRYHFPHRPQKRPIDMCPELDEYANDLLTQMLVFDQHQRPSAIECLNHMFFLQEPI